MDIATLTSAIRRLGGRTRRRIAEPRKLVQRRPVVERRSETSAPALRYEIKFAVPDPDHGLVDTWVRLNGDGFRVAYPRRRVRSIYFDSPAWDNVDDNLAGIGERAKLRLRWYGEELTEVRGTVEAKIKRCSLGYKLSQRLIRPLDFTAMSWPDIVTAMRERCRDDLLPYISQNPVATLINGYDRDYYVSADGRIRLTVDRNLTAYDQTASRRPQFERKLLLPAAIVIEVKAPAEEEQRLREVVAGIPARAEAFSKYTRAMMHVAGAL